MLQMLAEWRGQDRGGVGGGRPSSWAPGREGVCGRAWARTRCARLPGLGRKERGNSGAANRRPLWREARGAAKSATLRSGGGEASCNGAKQRSLKSVDPLPAHNTSNRIRIFPQCMSVFLTRMPIDSFMTRSIPVLMHTRGAGTSALGHPFRIIPAPGLKHRFETNH